MVEYNCEQNSHIPTGDHMHNHELYEELSDGQKAALAAWVDADFSPTAAASDLGMAVSSFNDRIHRMRKVFEKHGYASTVSSGLKDVCLDVINDCRTRGYIRAETPDGFRATKISQARKDGVVTREWVSYSREKSAVTPDDFEQLKKDLADSIPRSALKASQHAKGVKGITGKMAVYVLADIHFGMYAHADESGENHDIKISKSDVITAVQNLIDITPPSEEAMLLNLGDFFHANSRVPATPMSGNILDVDSRFSHVAREGVKLMRTCIDMIAARHKKINVVNVRGNHDPDAAMWLNIVMDAHYNDNKNVTVFPNDKKMISFPYGDTALFFYHGEKLARAHEYITGHPEHKKLHGDALRTYCLAGHIHHETVKTKSNIRFETFATITGKDAYHADNLYHASQNMVSIIYDQRWGEVNRSTVPIEKVRHDKPN